MVKSSLVLVLSLLIFSCRSTHAKYSNTKAEFSPNGVPLNWGNLKPLSAIQLTAEAKLANAAARRLNEAAQFNTLISGWSENVEIVDGIVSIPVKLLANDGDDHNHPFGDGQKNASVGWEGWPDDSLEPPLLMTLADVKVASSGFRLLVLEPAIKMIDVTLGSAPTIITAEVSNDQGLSVIIKLVKDSQRGVYRAIIGVGRSTVGLSTGPEYPANFMEAPAWLAVISDHWAWPRIKVRFFTDASPTDSRFWPILFRFPSQNQSDAQACLPSAANSRAGRPITLPPYESSSAATAADALNEWFAAQAPSNNVADLFRGVVGSGVHNQFSDSSGHIAQTATGGVDTYVIKSHVGKTQILYTCFDARNLQNEAQWGVPSGAGWHSIGHELNGQSQDNWTFAETVVNSFEKSGIFAGWGVRTPFPFVESTPFEAKDVITYRVLRSGEAFTTAKSHFHWYAVDASQKICTVVLKHLGCPLQSDRDLQCMNH